ncbi:VirB4-like conjugal transfer ATPase, CD1110 family [Clostridium formicaceticum]|nr:ATP-binding protein [Clostridium formicaceticum]AOY78190.1 conjugal transfer protein TraE [Clostridium formicaceticum]
MQRKHFKQGRKKETLLSVVIDSVRNQKQNQVTSTQDTIPYRQMFKDGICQIDDTHFNKTIAYNDINYQLAHSEDKEVIFSEWCNFLNYFDHSVSFQLTFINELANIDEEKKSIEIKSQDDEFDDIREEYREMLMEQLEKGNNGLTRRKYITFTIECEGLNEAKGKLAKIENNILNNFKLLGVTSFCLNGKERLEVLHNILTTDKVFTFDWNEKTERGLSTKDYIAPSIFDFNNKRYFRMDKKVGQSLHMMILAPELSDRTLADFLDMKSEMIVSYHVQSIDQQKAIKIIKGKISDLDKMKIEEQKKAVRAGYDMDVIPTDINTYADEAKRILRDLQSRNERWFMVTIIVTNIARTKAELETNIFQAKTIGQQYQCNLKPYDYEQENCLMASLPIGVNNLYPKRGLTTSALAIFVPFTTQELFMGGQSLYYGVNALSNNMIMVDRKRLKNPNGLVLGVPGSGKSFSSKREITNVFLITDDDIIICDPEGEYRPLVEALGGQVINISPTSKDYVNPLDLNMDYSDDESPLALKSDFIMSLMELVCGGKNGLLPVEKTIIDRCVHIIYQKYLLNPIPENMPILEDLWNALKEQGSKEADNLADALEIYVKGSLQVFNHRTNVELKNRLVCFNIKELGKNLKKLGMLIVQDQVWNRVTINRDKRKSTWYYIDEFHLLLKEEQTSAYSVEIWKRFRKWGGIPTGITQNVKDFLESKEIENIFENSNFIYLLAQAPADKEFLSKKLNISKMQLSYVSNSPPGEGLLIYGGVIIPFKDHFPEDTKLYQLMTTRLEEQAG